MRGVEGAGAPVAEQLRFSPHRAPPVARGAWRLVQNFAVSETKPLMPGWV
jgi:hypothetical protein